MSESPALRIFLSSPGDVAEERALAEIVFRRLASEFRDAVRLDLVIWEHEPLFAHTGFQQQILRPSQCDLVVTILWSRLGTRLPDDFKSEGSNAVPTGTEFEVRDALASFKSMGKPNLLIYRKIPPPQVALGGADFAERVEQYRNLDRFCQEAFYDQQGRVLVAHTSFPDSHTFERRLTEHVREWLTREIQARHRSDPVSTSHQLPAWRGSSPFRGLLPFESEHQAIYFGRAGALSELLRRIRERELASSNAAPRLLLIQGMSGAGKTSLINAGLRPLLELRPVERIAKWSVVAIRPSDSDSQMPEKGALGVLASQLSNVLASMVKNGTSAAKLADMLRTHPDVAAAHIDEWIASDAPRDGDKCLAARLVIYIDQLEEVFALPNAAADATAFFAMMVALSQSEFAWIVATLRSDFAYRLEAIPELVKCLDGNAAYTLLPPRADELVDMIREPARAAGLLWEECEGVTLDQALLRDAAGNPEALPLLEYTLAELYEKRGGRYLRWSAYQGDLASALISAADEVVDGIADQGAFRLVMRELVSVGDDGKASRRYARLARISDGSSARTLLDRLVARRLCVTDQKRGEGPVAYLSHEALIRSWPKAQEWLNSETSLLRLRDELARDVATWEHHGRTPDYLGTAPEKLAVLREVEQAGLLSSESGVEYALQSRRRASRNRLMKQGAVSGICALTVVASIAWLVALKQKQEAQHAAATSNRTTQFMVSLFAVADPDESQGDTLTARQVLERGASEITGNGEHGLQKEPAIQAELLTAMGQSYTGLGLYESAEKLLAQAETDETKVVVPDESQVRTLLASGTVLFQLSQYKKAEVPLRKAVVLARRSLSALSTLRSQALTGLADDLSALFKFDEATALCNEALAADRQRVSAENGSNETLAALAKTLDSMGDNYLSEKKLSEAKDNLREAVALRKKVLGMHSVLTGQSLNNLGVVLYESGRYQESLAAYKSVLPIYSEVYGEKHREIATLLSNLGGSELMLGDIDGAQAYLKRALAMTDELEGRNHEDVVPPLNRLAMIDEYRGRLESADTEIRRAAEIARMPEHGALLNQVLLTQGNLEFLKGNHSVAAELLLESKQALDKIKDKDKDKGKEYAWQEALWRAVNAQITASNGDIAAAKITLTDAQSVLSQRFGDGSFYMLVVKRIGQSIDATPSGQRH